MRWKRTESSHYQRRGGMGGLGLPVTAGGGVLGLLVLLAFTLLGGGGGGGGGGSLISSMIVAVSGFLISSITLLPMPVISA